MVLPIIVSALVLVNGPNKSSLGEEASWLLAEAVFLKVPLTLMDNWPHLGLSVLLGSAVPGSQSLTSSVTFWDLNRTL